MPITVPDHLKDQLDLALLECLERLSEQVSGNFVVTCAHRDTAEQTILHAAFLAGGPRAASPYSSAHEVDPALAVDLELVEGNPHGAGTRSNWNPQDPRWLELIAKTNEAYRDDGESLDSLAEYGDFDHLELSGWWRQASAIAQRIAPVHTHAHDSYAAKRARGLSPVAVASVPAASGQADGAAAVVEPALEPVLVEGTLAFDRPPQAETTAAATSDTRLPLDTGLVTCTTCDGLGLMPVTEASSPAVEATPSSPPPTPE